MLLLMQILAADSPTATFDPSSIMPAVSNLGALGFAVWYAYYVTTVAIPKLIEAHRQERVETLTAHRQERIDMQTRFDTTLHGLLEEMRAERELFLRLKPKSECEK